MSFDQIKVELLSSWEGKSGGDGTIAHAAWASTYDVEKLTSKTDEDIRRAVTNVIHHHHDTPKERLWMEFFITCPINIERQFDKYRMTVQYQDFQVEFFERPMGGDHITQNELSGRYRTIPERAYELPWDVAKIMVKAEDPKYLKLYTKPDNMVRAFIEEWRSDLKVQYREYKYKLETLKKAELAGTITNKEYKRAREVLRGYLGTAFLTDMRIVMNLNAFEHIINQRLESAAQSESRVVAYRMVNEVINHKVSPVAITNMIEANKWQPSLLEVGVLIEEDLW